MSNPLTKLPRKRAEISRRRSSHGSILLMALAACIVIVVIGLGIVAVVRLFGGFAELGNATNAGSLNVAKQMSSTVGVPLLPEEVNEFGDLVDKNGLVTIRTFNAIVARAIITVLTAEQLGTPEALSEAQAVAKMAQCGDNSIGKRLHDAVENAADQRTSFQSLAEHNSKNMIGSVSQIDQDCSQAFVYAGSSSNIYIDYRYVNEDQLARLAAQNALCTGTDGNTYLKGYTTIDLGYGCVFQLVPLKPGADPHLVSDSLFEQNSEARYASTLPASLAGAVPPNCFRTVSKAPFVDLWPKAKVATAVSIPNAGGAANKDWTKGNNKNSPANHEFMDANSNSSSAQSESNNSSQMGKSGHLPANDQFIKAHSNAVIGALNCAYPASFATVYQSQGHARKFYFATAHPAN